MRSHTTSFGNFKALELKGYQSELIRTQTAIQGEIIDLFGSISGTLVATSMLLGPSYLLGVLSVAVVGTYVFFQRQARDALAGCWYILRDKTYATGDYIIVGTEEGFVSEVGLYRTILMDAWNPAKRTIIHHSLFSENTVQVRTRDGRMLYDEVFYSAYGDQPDRARAALHSAGQRLREHFGEDILLSIESPVGPVQDTAGYKWRVQLLICIDKPSNLMRVAGTFSEMVWEEFSDRGLRIPGAQQVDVFLS